MTLTLCGLPKVRTLGQWTASDPTIDSVAVTRLSIFGSADCPLSECRYLCTFCVTFDLHFSRAQVEDILYVRELMPNEYIHKNIQRFLVFHLYFDIEMCKYF